MGGSEVDEQASKRPKKDDTETAKRPKKDDTETVKLELGLSHYVSSSGALFNGFCRLGFGSVNLDVWLGLCDWGSAYYGGVSCLLRSDRRWSAVGILIVLVVDSVLIADGRCSSF